MRRWSVPVVVLVAALLLAWRTCGASERGARRTSSAGAGGAGSARARDLRWSPGGIAGSIVDGAHAPVPDARVCARRAESDGPYVARGLICTSADARGAYAIDVPAGRYVVSAVAARHLPARLENIDVRPSERRPGVDIVVYAGGVELSGTVSDLGGGPIARARVSAMSTSTYQTTASVETDDAGAFHLWVWAGEVGIEADADGYAHSSTWGSAPGVIAVTLTPAVSLAGTVIDASTREPVADALVWFHATSDHFISAVPLATTDDHGRFRAENLAPERYELAATADHRYGRTSGAVRVGLGQTVEDAVIEVNPAVNIEGSVSIDGAPPQPCPHPSLWVGIADANGGDGGWLARASSGGRVRVEGVPPGHYAVRVDCEGYEVADDGQPLDIAERDVTGLAWTAHPRVRGSIRGRVLASSGAPIASAQVISHGSWSANATTASDGSYELTGLVAGGHDLEVRAGAGVTPIRRWHVDLAAGATISKDLVLEAGGAIVGSVTTADGAPVGDVRVRATVGSEYLESISGVDGAFHFDNLPAGTFDVWVESADRRATVTPGSRTRVSFVIEARPGLITGTVVGADGRPRGDVFVSWVREYGGAADRHRLDDPSARVLPSVDGTFVLSHLPAGIYTVRASEAGGTEVVATHVPTGGTARLAFTPSGSIAGTVRGREVPSDIEVWCVERRTGLSRADRFYNTAGRFRFDELPAGSYAITVHALDAEGQTAVDLAAGGAVQGAVVDLSASVTLTGRVLDVATRQPLADIGVYATLEGLDIRSEVRHADETSADGRFEIEHVPSGEVRVSLHAAGADFGFATMTRRITPESADLGDLFLAKRRTRPGERAGRIGVDLAADAPRITWLDPAGPAANAGIVLGDVLVSIEGISLAGVDGDAVRTLLSVPVGATLQLGLARGVTISVVAVPRA